MTEQNKYFIGWYLTTLQNLKAATIVAVVMLGFSLLQGCAGMSSQSQSSNPIKRMLHGGFKQPAEKKFDGVAEIQQAEPITDATGVGLGVGTVVTPKTKTDAEWMADGMLPPRLREGVAGSPKKDFCSDIKTEFGSTYQLSPSNNNRVVKVNIAGQELSLGILKSTTIRAPNVAELNGRIGCLGNGGYWIVSKIERGGDSYTLTQRSGTKFNIAGKGPGDDLSALVGLPESTVLISYPITY